jgi:hypothetical protein
MSKYEPLQQFLVTAHGEIQQMSFRDVERILGFKLPKSAYEHEAWWSNNTTGHSHARAWVDFGWRTDVDLASRRVTFQRTDRRPSTSRSSQPRDPWGCMAGTITFMPGVDLTAPTGDVWNAQEGRLLNE